MTKGTVLISGASVAGPALAYWLHRHGFTTTVVEQAPALRAGGHAVDFRGEQLEVLRRMGILEDLRAVQTGMGDQIVIDDYGRRLVSLPSALFSGEVEVLRGDLSRILFEATKDSTEYVFGDRITALAETADGVRVTFDHGASRTFDLVVGADGLHSGVRALAFGPESEFRRDSGYYQAGFAAPNYLGLDRSGLIYNIPGAAVMVSSGADSAEAGVGFVFASDPLEYDRRDVVGQKRIVADAFAGAGWQAPKLIELMAQTPELYFDAIAQIHVDTWSKGRIVLLGDAAWCAGPGGSGTGLAMVGAYILAGELATGDHASAFARYEDQLRSAATSGKKQAGGAGAFLAPMTTGKIRSRNRIYRVLSTRLMSGVFTWLITRTAKAITLKDYPVTTEFDRAAS